MSHFGGTYWLAVDAVLAPGYVSLFCALKALPGGLCAWLSSLLPHPAAQPYLSAAPLLQEAYPDST